MDPSCMPPIDCQTWRPRSISARVNTVVPSVVTTRSGIGGELRLICRPDHNSTENETISRMARPVQSLRCEFMRRPPCDPAGSPAPFFLAGAQFYCTILAQEPFANGKTSYRGFGQTPIAGRQA